MNTPARAAEVYARGTLGHARATVTATLQVGFEALCLVSTLDPTYGRFCLQLARRTDGWEVTDEGSAEDYSRAQDRYATRYND
jgi:hypothetical protein